VTDVVPRLGAVLIAKDEAANIERCLVAAAFAGVEVVTLLDTGSTDDTVAIAQRVAGETGLDLRVAHTTFANFGQARSEAFALAHGTADWLVALDADMALAVDDDWEPDAGVEALMVEMGAHTPYAYRLPLVLSGAVLWRSHGAVHEYTWPADGHDPVRQSTDAVRIDMGPVDRGSPEKYAWHLALLDAALAADPDNARDTYYRAQTLRSLGRADEARAEYLRRAGMAGFVEETYYAAYSAAVLAPDWPTRAAELLAAWEMRPQRLEALHALVREMNQRDLHHAAYALTSEPIAPCADVLFVHREAWDWGITFERSIAAYWVGWTDESRDLCDRLLANPHLPDHIRAQVIANRAFCNARAA
jgi:glycosyltransferase involved in cell wall biosynthesis